VTQVTFPQILYISGHENDPLQQTLYHGDGSVFDGTGYTPSMALRQEYATTNALTVTGAGVVDWVGATTLGVVRFTPADGALAALLRGFYRVHWIATAGGRTKHFAGGRVELRTGY
jgi:hypothetical protein